MKEVFVKRVFLVVMASVFLIMAQTAIAEDKWRVELRGDAAFPTQDLDNANLDTGFGFEAIVAYKFMPHLGAYAGWGWHHFGSDGASFAGTDVTFEETGYTFGLEFIHPIGKSSASYFVQAGGLYNHIEVEDDNLGITTDSGHGLGWQIGAGISFPLDADKKWHVTPSLRYRSLSRDMEFSGVKTDVDLSYVAVGVGISRAF
jgi:hypothetical protein